MMAAGAIVIAHKSSGSKVDIIDEGKTGFFASDVDSYTTMMEQILDMTDDERCEVQERARRSVERFTSLNFERLFMEPFHQILLLK